MADLKYFDTHAHLQGEFYHSDANTDLKLAQLVGVKHIVLPGTDKLDSFRNLRFALQHSDVYAAVGLHPSEAKDERAADFLDNIDFTKVVALGETGIDLYRDTNPPLALQQVSFRKHIALALKHNKPIIVHARNADEQVYEEVSQHKMLRVIMHCYTGTAEYAQKFVALGAFISIAGMVTYPKATALQELVKQVPLTHLLVETDAPFLSPQILRGKPNAPQNVVHVAQFVANLRDEPNEVVLEALYQNALRAFGLEE